MEHKINDIYLIKHRIYNHAPKNHHSRSSTIIDAEMTARITKNVICLII